MSGESFFTSRMSLLPCKQIEAASKDLQIQRISGNELVGIELLYWMAQGLQSLLLDYCAYTLSVCLPISK